MHPSHRNWIAGIWPASIDRSIDRSIDALALTILFEVRAERSGPVMLLLTTQSNKIPCAQYNVDAVLPSLHYCTEQII